MVLFNLGKITNKAVHCDTREKCRELLLFLEKQGFIWSNGEKPTRFNSFGLHGIYSCILVRVGNDGRERLEFGYTGWYREVGIDVVEYDDMVVQPKKGGR